MPASIMTGIPGGNPGGGQNVVPTTGATTSGAIGGQINPLQAPFPAGGAMPSSNSTISALMGMNPAGSSKTGTGAQGGNIGGLSTDSIVKAFHKAGFPSGIGYLLAQFLEGGAGFNPQAVKAMLDALGPGIERGQANILEQFGSMGLRNSSPAAIGLGDFNSQVVLDEGQIISQMYEQAVQNYMTVLMGGKKDASQGGGMGAMLGGAGQLASAIIPLLFGA